MHPTWFFKPFYLKNIIRIALVFGLLFWQIPNLTWAAPSGSPALSEPFGTESRGQDREVQRVVVISIDGLRADAVTPTWTPALNGLMKRGASTLKARCTAPTYTIPNHVTMVTGLLPASHGFEFNRDPGRQVVPAGSIFEQIRRSGRTTALYVSKYKLRLLAHPRRVDRHVVNQSGTSKSVVARFLVDIRSPETRWDFCFIHLIEPDAAGHKYGWMSQRYLNAVYAADQQVSKILIALGLQRLIYETLVIVTSDHGGEGFEHGTASSAVLTIPWIAAGAGVPEGWTIQQPVRAQDLAPTVLHAFGLPVPPSMQGAVVEEIFRSSEQLQTSVSR